MYTAVVETAIKEIDLDEAIDKLVAADVSPSLSQSPSGYYRARISVAGESLMSAMAAAAAIVQDALGVPAVGAYVHEDGSTRTSDLTIPELVSVSEAADMLQVSRQAVLQRIGTGSLPASKVGREYAIPASAVR